MNQKHILIEHLSDINSVIKHPLRLTNRIKFTCFDVSQNFIVFGATSGGLYVFNRYPHVFIKLIPSKHGSVIQVAIAPNEKTLVLSTSKGLVIVIENCFTECNVQYQVYCKHEGNLITAIKWHADDIYCGDNTGKISVITLPNLLTKAIFQTPCTSLMQLDSTVVQIECYSKFLLISTYTRTYICDTDKEQYRQIGKKLRDGCFGACFHTSDNSEALSTHASTSRGLFRNLKEDEQFLAVSCSDNVKIFCGRPGARMWEAKLDGSVTCTHQFRNFLKQKPTNIVHINDDDTNAHLKITTFEESESKESEVFNFTKVFLLNNKFIFTFNSEGFYVFNPETLTPICWCSYFKSIKDIKIISNFMYISNETGEIHVVALYDLEKIILKTLFNKQYYVSSELCINYLEDILKLVETSDRIHLVSILKDKLTELEAHDLLENLSPLLKAIQDFSDQKCAGLRLTTGIIVVNNSYMDAVFEEPKNDKDQLPETLQTLKEIGINVTDKLTETTKHFKEKLQILEATVKNLTSDDTTKTYTNTIAVAGPKNTIELPEEDLPIYEKNSKSTVINLTADDTTNSITVAGPNNAIALPEENLPIYEKDSKSIVINLTADDTTNTITVEDPKNAIEIPEEDLPVYEKNSKSTINNVTSVDIIKISTNSIAGTKPKNAVILSEGDPPVYGRKNSKPEILIDVKTLRKIIEAEPIPEINHEIKIFHQQYELTKLNPNIEIPKFKDIFEKNNLNDLVNMINNFEQHMLEKNTDKTILKHWCYKQYLKQVSKKDVQCEITKLEVNDPAMNYLFTAFHTLNFSPQHSCPCSYPLPSAKTHSLMFYEIGCAILRKYKRNKPELYEKIKKEIPFMWKGIIENWKNSNIDTVLPLLIQFGDETLLATFLNKFKYDTWDNAVKLVIKLKNKTCLNCDNKFDNNCDVISWTIFATLMVQSIGGPSAINLLMRYANFIPSEELTTDFYQSCIFATTADDFQENLRKKAINFTQTVQAEENTSKQFDNLMVKFLHNKYVQKATSFYKTFLLDVETTDSNNCSFCDLPMNTPLINQEVKLRCNHTFHMICLKYNKNVCIKCEKSCC